METSSSNKQDQTSSEKQGPSPLAILARQELERRRRANPLKYFVPNGAIETLIHAVGEHRETGKFIFVLPAANSVGKTAAAIAILGNAIYGPQSKWFDYELFRNWPYPKKFWYISEQTTLRDFVCGIDEESSEIRKWMPEGRYEFSKAGLEFFSHFTSDTGWSGNFKTFDQLPSKFESDKVGMIILDEPPPEPIFNACLARLTLGGVIIMPMTPLFSAGWVADRLVDESNPNPHVFTLRADIEDNCREHGVRGRLEHAQIERLVANYEPEEKEARAHGKFMYLSGLIYHRLHADTHRHAMDPGEFTQDKYRIMCICDPHDARPPFIGWAAVDRWGTLWFIDEFPQVKEFGAKFHEMKHFTMKSEDVVRRIKKVEQENNWDPRYIVRVMDPNFGSKPLQTVGKTMQQYYRTLGARKDISWPMHFSVKVSDDLVSGHRQVQDMITPNAEGESKLLVGLRCENIWYQLTHYAWAKRTGRGLVLHGEGEAVGQKFKDGSDVVRYAVMYLKAPKIAEQKELEMTYDQYVNEVVFERAKARGRARKPTIGQQVYSSYLREDVSASDFRF